MALPVEFATLLTFMLTVSTLVLSPGPDTLLILRYALGSGRGSGLAAVAGVQAGLTIHTALAVLGVSFLIASNPTAMRVVAVAGAAYLAWIGVQGFREGKMINLDVQARPPAHVKAFRDATLCNVLNPKVILMFFGLFPNFVIVERGDTGAQLITLAAALIVVNTLWQVQLAVMADAFRRWLSNPTAYKLVTHGTGALLIAIAALMLYENLW